MRKRIISVIGMIFLLLMSTHACAEMTTLKGSVWHSEKMGTTLVFKGNDCVEWTNRRHETVRGTYFSRGSLVEMRYGEGEVILSSQGKIEGEELIFPGLAEVFQLVSYEEDYGIDAEAVEERFFENYWYLGYDSMTLYESNIVADDGYVVRLHRNGTAEIICYEYTDVIEMETFEVAQEYFGYQVAKIGDLAFSGAQFTSIVIPDGIKCIGKQAFDMCPKLERVVLPEGLEEIGDLAFAHCPKLRNLMLPSSLVVIGEGAFSWCENITSVSIPDGLEEIEPDVFHGCSSLKEVCLPAWLKSIGSGAFCGCSALKKIELPDSLNEIGEAAFALSGLVEVSIPNSVTSIGIGSFMKCDNLEKVSIGSRISELPITCFAHNKALREIEIPASVQVIERHAFANTGLRKVVFLGSCKIKDGAFKSCPDLESIVTCGGLIYSEENFLDSPQLSFTQEERAQLEITKVEEGRQLPTQANWECPYVTLLSAEGYKEVDYKLWNKVIRVQDVVGGGFKIVMPKDGDCYISVMANELEGDSFNIEAYLYDEHIGSMRFERSDVVQTWVVKGLHKGDELCWWDNDNSGRWWTLQEPFKMMIEIE